MPPSKINVNKADINSVSADRPMPLDIMGLFFFAYRDFVGDADALLEKQGFGRAHHRVLYFVKLRPGMPVADLLDILKITKQSLARVLRQLIDNGYIAQQTGESDRRQRLLYATAKGQAYFQDLSQSQALRINKSLADLAPQDRETIKSFLIGMVDGDEHNMLDHLNLTEKR